MILLMLAAAFADAPAYGACCAAVGAGACPFQLDVIGAQSSTRDSREGVEVTGLWTLRCGMPNTWDANAKAVVRGAPGQSPPPGPGRVLTELSPDALSCFEAACNLPPDLCLAPSAQGTSALLCDTQQPATDAILRRPPDARSVAVIVRGQVRRAYRHQPSAAARGDASPSPGAYPALPASSSAAAARSSAPGTPLPGFDASLPDLPPNPCPTRSGLREPSNEQVQRGDNRRVEGDLTTAAGHYRAAISVNRCNAFAWSGLGHTFLAAGYASAAMTALEASTRLMPGLVAAWVSLGRAHEALGATDIARDAYRSALRYQTGHPEAEAALQRLGR